ncbi:MAG: hypothetical protein A2277_17850 [Desulfobacterales bacterium RIFOXYA12_FULL_46_15]|nr:MAG: hypothetical protein A2277_17850 [Desulfobacterales bacterium RIFOXYA12_FULL_46_15]
MKTIPSRDISGECTGECRDLVMESNRKRQKEIDIFRYSASSSPSVPWARSRNEPPGFLGGHV